MEFDLVSIVVTVVVSSAVGALVGGSINFLVFGSLKTLKAELKDLREQELKRLDDRLTAATGSRKEIYEKLEHEFVKQSLCDRRLRDQDRADNEIRAAARNQQILLADIDRRTASNETTLNLIARHMNISIGD